MKMHVLHLFTVLSLFACAQAPIKISTVDLKRIDPKCTPLAKVVTENHEGIEALARVEAENKVRELNGDTLGFEEAVRNGKEIKYSGVAFRCKNEE